MNEVPRQHLLTGALTGPVDRVEAYRVQLAPGQQLGSHTHPGGVVGYVESGRMSLQLDRQQATELSAGSVFFEPPGAVVNRVDNLSATEPATFIACYPLAGDQPLIDFG